MGEVGSECRVKWKSKTKIWNKLLLLLAVPFGSVSVFRYWIFVFIALVGTVLDGGGNNRIFLDGKYVFEWMTSMFYRPIFYREYSERFQCHFIYVKNHENWIVFRTEHNLCERIFKFSINLSWVFFTKNRR